MWRNKLRGELADPKSSNDYPEESDDDANLVCGEAGRKEHIRS